MADDIVLQLRDTRYPGQMGMRLQAAEIIEQYRKDSERDERTNNALRKALETIAVMDPWGKRADDLGRAARTAREALASVVSAAQGKSE